MIETLGAGSTTTHSNDWFVDFHIADSAHLSIATLPERNRIELWSPQTEHA